MQCGVYDQIFDNYIARYFLQLFTYIFFKSRLQSTWSPFPFVIKVVKGATRSILEARFLSIEKLS